MLETSLNIFTRWDNDTVDIDIEIMLFILSIATWSVVCNSDRHTLVVKSVLVILLHLSFDAMIHEPLDEYHVCGRSSVWPTL